MNSLGYVKRYGLLTALILLFIVSSLLFNSFFSKVNVINISIQASTYLLMALGLTIVMMAGEIDLSFAASIPLCSTVLTLGLNNGLGVLSILIILCILLFISGINSFFITWMKLSSFVTTIAMMFFLTGVSYALFGGKSYWLTYLSLKNFLEFNFFIIPISVVLVAITSILLIIFTLKTKYGRHLRACGENAASAQSNGLNLNWYKFLAFLIAGICYTLATVVMNSRLSGSVGPSAGGNVMLPVMAIAFLGQTTFIIGRPNIIGTFVAGFFMATVENALILSNVVFYYVPVIQGVILVVAIVLSSIGDRKLVQLKFI